MTAVFHMTIRQKVSAQIMLLMSSMVIIVNIQLLQRYFFNTILCSWVIRIHYYGGQGDKFLNWDEW